MRILLDTNVLLRTLEPGHAHHQSSVAATDLLRKRGNKLVIVPQVLYESWAVATRPVELNGLGMSPAALRRLFRLLRDERAVFDTWEQLVLSLEIKGKQAHDARLAAAMQRHEISHLLTFNAPDFKRYSFIGLLNPDDVLHGATPV
jgi:predicted nucleic acid-binding protein